MPPKFTIPSHVLAFSLLTAPGILYAVYWMRNHHTDDEMEKILEKKFSSDIQINREKRDQLMKVLSATKNPGSDPDQERQFERLLHGGKK